MTLLSPQVFANEQTTTATQLLSRGIIFTNTKAAATAITSSAQQNEIEAWYEANLFQNNTPSTVNKITTSSYSKTSTGDTCQRTRSIVMLGNNGTGTAISNSQVTISTSCPQ
jgi:hypothetical protein